MADIEQQQPPADGPTVPLSDGGTHATYKDPETGQLLQSSLLSSQPDFSGLERQRRVMSNDGSGHWKLNYFRGPDEEDTRDALYFLETSGKAVFSSRQACSLESAGKFSGEKGTPLRINYSLSTRLSFDAVCLLYVFEMLLNLIDPDCWK